MKIILSKKTIGLFFLFGYLAFVPSGPYPVFIGGGIKLDVFFAAGLLVFLLFYSPKLNKWPSCLLVTYFLYLITCAVSSFFSENVQLSFEYFFIIFGYSLIAMLGPVVFEGREALIRKWIFVCAVGVGVLIAVLYNFHRFAQSHRFALGLADLSKNGAMAEGVATVDPNMTAAGLALSLLIYLPALFHKKRFVLPELFGVVCILGAVLITLSRSALLGLGVAVVIAACVTILKHLIANRFILKKTMVRMVLLFILLVALLILIFNLITPDIFMKVTRRIMRSSQDSARLLLLHNAWDVFYTSPKTILIGKGFMTTNPHNEIMRTLSTTGLFGMATSAGFLLVVFYITLKRTLYDNRMHFAALAIILYMMTITLFYGYTKLIWVALMFLLFLYREAVRRSSHY